MPKLLENAHLEDLEDRFNALFDQEDKYACSDYLHEVVSANNFEIVVDENCRKIMANWCHRITSYCKFSADITCIAMRLIDRLLSTSNGKSILYDKRAFQLATVCCLHITIKLHETRTFDMTSLSKLCRGFYDDDEFTRMEHAILSSLKWNLCPPTPYAFLELFLDLLPPSSSTNALLCQPKSSLLELVNKQIIVAVQDYNFVAVNPSLIAISSLLNALDYVKYPSHLQASFLHNIHVVTELDCTNHFVTNLKQYLICGNNMQHQSNNNTIGSSSNHDSTNASNAIHDSDDSVTTKRSLHSPVCVVSYEE